MGLWERGRDMQSALRQLGTIQIKLMMAHVFSNKTNVWRSSNWNDFLSHREPSHVTWYCCTWWTPAHTTERRSLKSSTLSMANCNQCEMSQYGFQIQYFPDVVYRIHWRFFANRRDKASVKEGKERHKNRTSRKPATERGANNSSHQPAETEHPLASSEENQLPVDKRGPTIPRNTGQRYSALLSPQGAEPRQHITFSSHN